VGTNGFCDEPFDNIEPESPLAARAKYHAANRPHFAEVRLIVSHSKPKNGLNGPPARREMETPF